MRAPSLQRLLLVVAAVGATGCSREASPGATADSASTQSAGGHVPGVGGAGGVGGGFGGAGSAGGGMGGASGGVPLDGFGTIVGGCDELEPDELMTGAAAFTIANEIDFGMRPFSRDVLSPGGQTIFDDPNAGGSSKESEIIAYEVLYRCELAELLKTETEIVYDTNGTITDMLVDIDDLKIGVSVVRAFKFMAPYTVQDALTKMEEKLDGIQESNANVSAEDAWTKQILHVIAEKPENVTAVQEALPQIDAASRGDTIVIITLTSGDDAFAY